MNKKEQNIYLWLIIPFFPNLALFLCLEFLVASNDLMIWMFILMFASINFIIALPQLIIYRRNYVYFRKATVSILLLTIQKIGFWNYTVKYIFVLGGIFGGDWGPGGGNFALFWFPFKAILIFTAFPVWFLLKFISTKSFYKFLKNKNLEEEAEKEIEKYLKENKNRL